MDQFDIVVSDVGQINKIRLWHDNKGLGAAWHVDKVELKEIKTGKMYTFMFQKWLSLSEGDKSLVAEAPVFKIEIMTEGNLVELKNTALQTNPYTVPDLFKMHVFKIHVQVYLIFYNTTSSLASSKACFLYQQDGSTIYYFV